MPARNLYGSMPTSTHTPLRAARALAPTHAPTRHTRTLRAYTTRPPLIYSPTRYCQPSLMQPSSCTFSLGRRRRPPFARIEKRRLLRFTSAPLHANPTCLPSTCPTHLCSPTSLPLHLRALYTSLCLPFHPTFHYLPCSPLPLAHCTSSFSACHLPPYRTHTHTHTTHTLLPLTLPHPTLPPFHRRRKYGWRHATTRRYSRTQARWRRAACVSRGAMLLHCTGTTHLPSHTHCLA